MSESAQIPDLISMDGYWRMLGACNLTESPFYAPLGASSCVNSEVRDLD